jgi:DNA-binding NarL/FixJ family response regulator
MVESTQRRDAVVIEDDLRWCNLIVAVLARLQIDVVSAVGAAPSALTLIAELRPDLLVANAKLALAEVDGSPFLSRGLLLHPVMRCIAVSDEDDPAAIVQAFRAGAHAYVLKSAQPDEFAAAVRQVFKRSVFYPATRGGLAEAAATRARAQRLLTRREMEILEFVAAGVPNAVVARSLWVSQQTVKFHLSNLYKKIGVSNRTEASRWAYEHGVLGRSARQRPQLLLEDADRVRP